MKSSFIKGKSIEPGIKVYSSKIRGNISDFNSTKRSKSHSRIIKGGTVRQTSVQPSIPSKYQRVLVNSKPKKTRFSKNYDFK